MKKLLKGRVGQGLAILMALVLVAGAIGCGGKFFGFLKSVETLFCGPSLAEKAEAVAGGNLLNAALMFLTKMGIPWSDPLMQKVNAGFTTFYNIQAGVCVTLVALNEAIAAVDAAGKVMTEEAVKAKAPVVSVPAMPNLRAKIVLQLQKK